mmetsp:Transcript_17025/g.20045  ORF Transcript_17025/g.20045 Transcript_17025/m.20045 type:complete len:158 (+) Transcript_17025:73-546(+)
MELSEEELEALTLAFHMYDLDGSGAIDTYELKKALESMGQNPSDQDVLELMAAMDEDNSGTISFIEFMNMVKFQKQLALDRDDDADMLMAFVALGGGKDMSGHVERKKLVSTVKYDFGLPINIEEMIDALDEDGSGEIEWSEFKELFTSPQQNPDLS